jgi:octanoyl-[GcvH]:protein N-octanoyltransferase
VLLDAGPSLRAVLADVYAALEIEWEPRTAGSLADVAAAPALAALAERLATVALAPGGLEAGDRRRAIELEPAHRA